MTHDTSTAPPARWLRSAAAALLCAALAGCHWDMWDQPRYEPLEKSANSVFSDGFSSRPLVDGTVPYQQARVADPHFYTGRVDGQFAAQLPAQMVLDEALLRRGQERFEIFCTPCHGFTGNGDGMVVQRGFPQPPSYHIDRLREAQLGYFYDVMTNGFGRMYSYASRIKPEDRWAIAAYVRTLQLSQNAAPGTDLVSGALLDEAKAAAEASAEATAEDEEEHEDHEQH